MRCPSSKLIVIFVQPCLELADQLADLYSIVGCGKHAWHVLLEGGTVFMIERVRLSFRRGCRLTTNKRVAVIAHYRSVDILKGGNSTLDGPSLPGWHDLLSGPIVFYHILSRVVPTLVRRVFKLPSSV